MFPYLISILARSIGFSTAHVVLEQSKLILETLAVVSDDLKGTKKMVENLHRAAKKFIVQNWT